MCPEASFHLKFTRQYPLLAFKLLEIWVVFKTESGKKRRCGIIRDKLTTTFTVSNSILPSLKHWKLFILYETVRQTSMQAMTYCLLIFHSFSIPLQGISHLKYQSFIGKIWSGLKASAECRLT